MRAPQRELPWLTGSMFREEIIMVNRVLRDDPTKSSMHNREGLTVRKIWHILKDWRMWPIYALGIIFMGQ